MSPQQIPPDTQFTAGEQPLVATVHMLSQQDLEALYTPPTSVIEESSDQASHPPENNDNNAPPQATETIRTTEELPKTEQPPTTPPIEETSPHPIKQSIDSIAPTTSPPSPRDQPASSIPAPPSAAPEPSFQSTIPSITNTPPLTVPKPRQNETPEIPSPPDTKIKLPIIVESESSPDETQGVTNSASIINLPTPHYPLLSRRNGEQGVVILEIEVKPDGSVGQIRVTRSPGYKRLEQAAIKAAATAAFKPAMSDGHPVRSVIQAPFRFVIE